MIRSPLKSLRPSMQSRAPEQAVDLEQAVARLERTERDALDLTYRAGLTQKQIAAQLGISERTVRRAIAHALQDVAKLMSIDGPTPS